MRHSPKIACRPRYRILIIGNSDFIILHSELPREKHAVVALALGVQLVPLRVIPPLPVSLVVLRLVREIFRAAETARDSIGTVLQRSKLSFNGIMELLEYLLLLLVGEAHLLNC